MTTAQRPIRKKLSRTAARIEPRRWRAYLLRCADGTLYAGVTNDVAVRVASHNGHPDGRGARYTRSRRPVELAWRSAALEKSAAFKLEARLKRISRAEKMALIAPPCAQRRQILRALMSGLR
jgi:putative endonuclease